MSDNPIRGTITAVCGDEKYLYVALWTGAPAATTGTTYILAGSPDNQLGEWAWHPLAKFPDNKRCDAMFISSLWTNPHLWMGYGNDVAYIKLPRGMDNPALDANCTYALTGTLRYQRHDLNAPDSYKVWKCIEIESDNLTAERYITVYTRVDNGSWVNWGNAHQSPRTRIVFSSDGIAGKTIELRLDFTLPSSEVPIIVRSVVLRAAERPDAIESYTAVVRCDDNVSTRTGGRAARTGAETWEALQAMLSHNGSVELIDPLGIERQVLVIAPLEMSEGKSREDARPEMLATVRMIGWDETDINTLLGEFVLNYGATGWPIPWIIPWTMGGTSADSSLTINYTGTAVSRPTLVLTGQITGATFVVTHPDGTTQTLAAAFNVAAGEIYTIDCVNKTVKNKSNTAVAVTVNDFYLTPGVNTIRLTGTDISATTACKIAYRTENLIA